MRKTILSLIFIYLLSFAVILFEITLSRYFSYILTYHFVFIIIAFSLLGLSIGQILFARKFQLIYSNLTFYYVVMLLAFSLSVAALIYVPRFDYFSSGSLGLLTFIILSIIPFIAIGILFGYIFQINNLKSSLLYAFDLFGGASAALVSYYLLNSFNLINIFGVVLLFLFATAIVGNLFSSRANKLLIAIYGFSIFILIFLIAQNFDYNFQVVKSLEKDLIRFQSNPSIKTEIVESRWSSFGRTDLVKITDPDGTVSKSMFIDAAAGTQIFDIDELEKDSVKLNHTLMHFGAFFPFNFLKSNEKDSALIIGPGGGLDIIALYFGNTKFIEAVEVNPSFVELMKKYNPATFSNKSNINIVVQEGRNFVRTTDKKYDLILLTIPITKGIRSSDFLNLTENFLFTVEAISDYLKILTDEGRIIYTLHNSEEVFKMLSNYFSLKAKEGISPQDALKSVYIISDGMKPTLVIKKNPFTPREIQQRHFLAHNINYDREMFYFPYIKQVKIDTVLAGGIIFSWQMFNQIIMDVSENKYDFHEFSNNAAINFHPVFDDSPFFFNYEIGLPQNVITLLIILIVLLVFSLYAFKKKWFVKFKHKSDDETPGKLFNYAALLVLLINISDILIQAYVFQKLNLNLSSPLKSFTLLLSAFLLGNGIGSIITKFIKPTYAILSISFLSVIVITLLEVLLIIPLSSNINSEVLLFLVVLLPSVFIGIPFPIILIQISKFNETNGIATLLGVSGIGCFIGSIITIIIATLWGYNSIIAVAVAIYLIVIVISLLQKRLNTYMHITTA
jgi:Spermine/spermidine synthase domain